MSSHPANPRPALAFGIDGDTLIVVVGARDPAAHEWRTVREAAAKLARDRTRYPHARGVLVTEGGCPPPLHDQTAVRLLPVALLGAAVPHPEAAFCGWATVRRFESAEAALGWLQIGPARAASIAALAEDLGTAVGPLTRTAPLLAAARAMVEGASPSHRVQQERRRLAHELNRTLSEQLSQLRSGLAGFALRMPKGAGSDVGRLSTRVAQAGEELAGIVWAMESPMRSWHSVHTYLKEHVDDHQGLGPDCQLSCRGEGSTMVPGLVALHALRVIQEGLRNAFRHAHAQRIDIDVGCEVGELQLTLRDDGRGFNTAAEREHGGLRNIYARAEACDGIAHLDSGPTGTTWSVRLRWSP